MLRVRDQFDQKSSDIQKNIYLNGLQDRNETLFYRFILEHLEDIVPIIYTPTVAQACAHWSRIFRRARGIYITPRERGRMAEALAGRPTAARPVIVVTDNERILGIGDQGAGGMGIPIGKLALYGAAAGIHPARLVPISLDVGTNNLALLDDPMYLGYRERRIAGSEYEEFIGEFVDAVKDVYPDALVQWEDFANRTSFTNLETYRKDILSFNDDIQGTAAMAVAGLLAATRSVGGRMREHRVVIVGAGSAGIGIRQLIALAMAEDGASQVDIDSQLFTLDSRGLLVDGRPGLTLGKQQVTVPTSVITDWRIRDHPIDLEDVVRNAACERAHRGQWSRRPLHPGDRRSRGPLHRSPDHHAAVQPDEPHRGDPCGCLVLDRGAGDRRHRKPVPLLCSRPAITTTSARPTTCSCSPASVSARSPCGPTR